MEYGATVLYALSFKTTITIGTVFVNSDVNSVMMKRFFPLLLLAAGMLLLVAISSCNSKKKAAEAEAKQREQKYQQADRDKMFFQQNLPEAKE